jgi:hypothetical protein
MHSLREKRAEGPVPAGTGMMRSETVMVDRRSRELLWRITAVNRLARPSPVAEPQPEGRGRRIEGGCVPRAVGPGEHLSVGQ